jgi:RND family efflux transporter MFP subunit
VTVYSKLNAIVDDLLVEEGDRLERGQVLLRLEDREIRNEYEQAKISVGQARLALRQAEVRAQISANDYERALSLFEQQLTSQQEYDQAALANRTDSLASEEAQQQLTAAEARLEASAIQLEYTAIRSPIDGVLTSRLTDVGDRVNVNEELFKIDEFPPLWARIYVPEKNLPELRVGQKARIDLETFPDREFEGRIKLISPTVDASSGTLKVTIEMQQPGRALRPGLFGTVSIATNTRENAVAVPKKALVRERDLNYLFVVQPDNSVVRREVSLGYSEEDWVEILSGANEGEVVVTVGHETLNDGYPVMVQSWEGDNLEDIPTPPAPPRQVEPQRQMAAGPGSARPGGGQGRMFERLLENPEVRRQYEARLREDPGFAEDPQKRRAFVREMMTSMREARSQQ